MEPKEIYRLVFNQEKKPHSLPIFYPYYFQSQIFFSSNINVTEQYMALAGECLYFRVGR